jgi:hypothetical protein
MLSAPKKKGKKRKETPIFTKNAQCPQKQREKKKRHLSSPCSVPSRLGAGLAILEGRSSAPTTLPPPAHTYSFKAPFTLRPVRSFKALLSTFKALLSSFKALLSSFKALLSSFKALLRRLFLCPDRAAASCCGGLRHIF